MAVAVMPLQVEVNAVVAVFLHADHLDLAVSQERMDLMDDQELMENLELMVSPKINKKNHNKKYF